MAANKIPYHQQKRTKTNSEALKARWADPEFRERMANRKRAFTDWNNSEWRSRRTAAMITRMAERMKTEQPTDFEFRCYSFLDQCRVQYEKQHPIYEEVFTVVDAYVSSLRMCIYFDAEHWHVANSQNVKKDAEKRSRLTSLGYRVMVIRTDKWARRINPSDLALLRSAFGLK